DPHPAVPAGHRPQLARHRLRRRPRPHRRAEDRRLVHGRQDQHRRPDHPRDAAVGHQQGVRPDALRRIDPQRRHVLSNPGMEASTVEQVSASRCFGGEQRVYSHLSAQTGTPMRFGIYLPPQASAGPRPVLYWLSGLTCTEENFITKAGAQRVAAELGLVIVAPDTSPRGLGHPGEDDSYDFGTGAGFYVDATAEPW